MHFIFVSNQTVFGCFNSNFKNLLLFQFKYTVVSMQTVLFVVSIQTVWSFVENPHLYILYYRKVLHEMLPLFLSLKLLFKRGYLIKTSTNLNEILKIWSKMWCILLDITLRRLFSLHHICWCYFSHRQTKFTHSLNSIAINNISSSLVYAKSMAYLFYIFPSLHFRN